MQGSRLLVAFICTSLIACSTAQKWTVTSSSSGCSLQCDIFSGTCPYPSKCSGIYWLRRVQVSCFKRGMQLYQSGGEVWCGPETDPNWSIGIGRVPRSRRLSALIRRLARVDKAAAADLTEADVPRRMLRRSAAFEEAMERRRLASCGGLGAVRYSCPSEHTIVGCDCECRRDFKSCFTTRTGSQCTNIRRRPDKLVCNGLTPLRCIWDWRGYTPARGKAKDVEYCLNQRERCKRRCRCHGCLPNYILH
jgi:hypothetical protein